MMIAGWPSEVEFATRDRIVVQSTLPPIDLIRHTQTTSWSGVNDSILLGYSEAKRRALAAALTRPAPLRKLRRFESGKLRRFDMHSSHQRRLTPHPVGTYDSPMRIDNPVANGRPRTYIACTNPMYGPLEGARQWVKKQENWTWQEIATGHDAMVTAPAELARMLAAIG
jgi:hypothetical protein